ncbi:MAG: LLM class flavin-dependent oxidoreductase [Solirubrobacterales bacterium]|nr:LLM class flavin-dependent oxidoreductase [Solirubrobacterales bacterium]
MKIGAQFLPEENHTFLSSVRTADEVGYARAWLVDGQMLWHEVYVYMTQGLAATKDIVFGTAVTNTLTRHFSVTASAVATLAELYPGRVLLGLGRGDNAVRTLGLKPVPTGELAQTVPLIRALLKGEEVDIPGGRRARIRWAEGGREVPIMMAATGPKNIRLAGALADIVMLYVGTHPESVKWGIEHVRAGATQAGRHPDSVEIALLTAMYVSDDQEEAWQECRWAPAACANHIAYAMKWNPDHGMPETMTRLARSRDAYDYYAGHLDSKADHTAYLTGDLVDDFVLAGPTDKCLERIRQLERLGVAEISTAYVNGKFDQMKRVGREIIPAVAGAGVR